MNWMDTAKSWLKLPSNASYVEMSLRLSEKLKTLPPAIRDQITNDARTPLAQATLDRINAEMLTDPSVIIALQYVREHPQPTMIDGKPRMSIDTVEAVIAEKVDWAFRMIRPDRHFFTDHLAGRTDGNEKIDFMDSIGRQLAAPFLMRAIPYVWNNQMYALVISGELPRHTVSAQIPFNAVWFTFEDGVPIKIKYPEMPPSSENKADGMLGIQLADRIRILVLGANDLSCTPFCLTEDIIQGSIYPDDIHPYGRQTAHYFLSCLSFINSPYIVIDSRQMIRQARRRLGIKGEVPEPQKARFITLRTPLYKRDYQESHTDIDWKFRWLVRGHHRAQWCPSTRDHKLMWIAPYVKGPPDMPMKTTAYKVVR